MKQSAAAKGFFASSDSSSDEKGKPGGMTKKKRSLIPIIVENPDGSMAEGVPPGYKERVPPSTTSLRFLNEDGIIGDMDSGMLREELSLLHSRHEYLFVALLVLQFICEATFNALYVLHASISIEEVKFAYPRTSEKTLVRIFWIVFALELVYCVAYYGLGMIAVWTKRPKYYRSFTNWCLVGICGQLLMAYVNKFNMLIFFLRLLAYIYSKFLRQLASHMMLVPESTEDATIAQEDRSDPEDNDGII